MDQDEESSAGKYPDNMDTPQTVNDMIDTTDKKNANEISGFEDEDEEEDVEICI